MPTTSHDRVVVRTTDLKDEILHYRAALAYNAEVFLIEQGAIVKAFSAVNDNFAPLLEPVIHLRDGAGHSHVSLVPFLLLLQRQARAAFQLFSVDQSYQGWVLARPGVESALIIGKWVDDPTNARIWQERQTDRAAYQKAYSGKALRSESLAKSPLLQTVLSKINDDFVHANPDYYGRHLQARPSDPAYVAFVLNYFDDDDAQEAHVLAFLHLLLLIQEDLAALFGRIFATTVDLPNGLSVFEQAFAKKVSALVARFPEATAVLKDLGGWQTAS